MKNFTREWQKVAFGLLVIAFISSSTQDAVANGKSTTINKKTFLKKINTERFVAWPITGKVTSATGEALPGVTVLVKGTTNGVTTGADGTYSLNVPEQAGTLVVSFIGFATKEIAFTKAGTYNITLSDDAKALEEVVVTGYTSEKKKDIIGSVSIVKTEELLATPTGNISSQLQGRAPGVTVSTSGQPGGSAKVRIRGFGSFGGSDPLYVIDGVPATSSGTGTSSVIDNLNPNDIESVQVLKDAASASVYGARAANGVIIITTKKGKAGGAKITVDSYYATSFFNKFPDMLNTKELGDAYWKGLAGAGYKVGDAAWTHPQYGKGAQPVIPEYILVNLNGTRIGGTDLEALRLSNPALFAQYVDPANYDFKNHQIVKSSDTDWFDEVFNPAPTQSYQLGASGGSEAGTYALSLNMFDQKNPASKLNTFNRYTLRANSSFNVHKKIRLGENVQVSYSNNKGSTVTQAAWVFPGLIPVYDIKGNPASSAAPGLIGTNDNGAGRNPITEPYRDRFDQTFNYGIFGNVYAEADLLKGLTARTSFGTDYAARSGKDFTQVTVEHAENTNPPNSLQMIMNNQNTWTWTNTLTYDKVFAQKHSMRLLFGSEALKAYAEFATATRTNFAFEDDPNFQVLSAGAGTQTNSGEFRRNTLFSLFTRVDYTFDDKYLFNATLRRDQSSKFGINNRTGYFPAVGLGWRLSSENFLKDVSWLNELKLRGSWGIIGNQNGLNNENQFNTFALTDLESYPIAGANNTKADSYTVARVGNPNAKWEQNITTNFGVDASFFGNSLDVSVEVYNKQTKDLLVTNQPPRTGVTATFLPAINAGDMTNKGIDLGIVKRGTVIGELRYDVGLTFSKYKNTVTKVLDNPLAVLTGGSTRSGNATLTAVGQPVSFFYGYKIDGFFNSQAEVDEYKATHTTWLDPAIGRWRIQDINRDNKVDAADRTFLGSPHPDFQSSLNISLGYKNFDFTSFIFWNQGGQIFNHSRYNTDFNTFTFNRSARMLYESWTPELGDKAKLPKLDVSDVVSTRNLTNYFVEDASYLRVKTLQLGYTIPQNLVSRLKLERVRVYVQAQNMLTLTRFSGLDPDTGQNGADDLSMGVVNNISPTPKQILFGLNLGL